ncbi:MAG: hypothetical protein JXR61_09610 [Prolixibacteraceae bacterium]|nr:hypothetical protein [Prolixibacteraceae bacterium]
MKFLTAIIIVFSFIFLISCGPSEEDKARVKLNYAKTLVENNDTTAALIQLDSIRVLYPEAVYATNAAKNMMNEINFDLLQKYEAELDSLEIKISELEKSFQKEKTDIDRYTRYIHKRQTFERAWDRSYIQVHLDETGDFYISSNYYGKNSLNHVALRVYDGGDDAKTDTIPLNSAYNHQSDFMDLKWEKVTYRSDTENGVIEFIANNTERNLKAVFLGKEYYYIILEDYDKIAVKEALALSKSLKKKALLKTKITSLQQKISI